MWDCVSHYSHLLQLAQHSEAYLGLGQPCYQVGMSVVGKQGSLAMCDKNWAVSHTETRVHPRTVTWMKEVWSMMLCSEGCSCRLGVSICWYELTHVEGKHGVGSNALPTEEWGKR